MAAANLEGFPAELRARFEPVRRVGEGGTGIVYEARPTAGGRSVAVKVIEPRHLATAGSRRAFLREAQAFLRLKHPHVVELIDFDAPAGGAAWLVTEFLGGGHLGSWRQFWPGWRAILQALDGALAALAFAHARGVVHCDIKPENILLETWTPQVRTKLADFGVVRLSAHSVPAGSAMRQWRTDQLSGTPVYMAPEQAEGDLGAYGPWTDIYALGVVLYEILAGRPPFDAESVSGILLKHLHEPMPALVLRDGIPPLPAIERLLEQMLAKDPWDRPRFAAHLRQELATLEDEAAALDVLTRPGRPLGIELTGAITLDTSLPTLLPDDSVGRGTLPGAGRVGAMRSASDLTTVSGSLQRLRAVETGLVGRGDELRTLASAAEAVRLEQRPLVILIEGPVGIGKSRLAQALRENLEEQGLMQTWSGSYRVEAAGTSATGLRGAVEAFYLCLGKDRRQLTEALEARLRRLGASDPWELKALTAWLRPGAAGEPTLPDAPAVGLALRAVERACRRYPLCIWLDDVHHALDGQVLPFAERLLRAPRVGQDSAPTLTSGLLRAPAPRGSSAPLPVLLVLSGRTLDETSDPSGFARDWLARLERDPYFVRMTLGPLSPHAVTRLLVEEIGLEAEVATRITERTAGQPHLALQAARATVQLRGLRTSSAASLPVVPTRDAVTLLADDDPLIEPVRPVVISPLSSGRLLQGYVEEVLASLPQPAAERVLGMLALLGPAVSRATLEHALECAWPQDEAVARSLDAILATARAAGLIDQPQPDGRRAQDASATQLLLSHEPLTRLLAARLERRGEAARAHQAAAEALRRRAGHGQALAERARHLQRAERPSDAWVLMWTAVEDAVEHARYSEAVALASELDSWLDRWGEARDSERRGQLLRAMAQAAIRCGALHEAARHLEAELGRASDDAAVLAERALLQAELLAGRGEFGEACVAFETARVGYDALGLTGQQARALLGLAGALRAQGELERARRAAEAALALYGTLAEARGRASALRALGQIDVYLGELDGALASYTAALELFESLGDLHGTADAERGMGGVFLEQGQPEEAQALLHRALSRYETIGDLEGAGHALRGLARARMLRGQPESARANLERAVRHFQQLGARMGAASCLLDLASCLRAVAAQRGGAESLALLDEALAALEEALSAYRQAGDERGTATALMTLGNVLLDGGRAAEAIARHQEALRHFWRLGHGRGVWLARLNLGHAHLMAGHLDEAQGLLAQAESESRDAGASELARLAAGYRALCEVRRDHLDAVAAAIARASAAGGPRDTRSVSELAVALERVADELLEPRAPAPPAPPSSPPRRAPRDHERASLYLQTGEQRRLELARAALEAAAAVHEELGQQSELERVRARHDLMSVMRGS